MPKKISSRKAQAALEFLATYGWAFLIILIMIATLAYFGVLSPSKLLPERCSIGSEISCMQYRLGQTDAGTGVLRLRLKNNLEPIVVTSWNTSSDSGIPFTCSQNPPSITWVNGETRDFEFTGCNNKDAGIVLGQKGKVNVKVNYYLTSSSSAFSRSTEGEIVATVTRVEGLLTQTNCSDDTDNDGNGCIDYAGGDTGCSSPSDTTESGGICPNGGGAGLSLYCFVSTNCPDTVVFKLSGLKDAHAEIPTLSNFDYKACCRTSNDTISSSCSSPDVIPLHLSAQTDAHVEKNTQANYAANVCLTANTKTITCAYTAGSCASDETCLSTISADTDAHVGDCVTQPFSNKICCRIS